MSILAAGAPAHRHHGEHHQEQGDVPPVSPEKCEHGKRVGACSECYKKSVEDRGVLIPTQDKES